MSVDWPIVSLSEIVVFKTGRLDSNAAEDGGEYPFFTCSPKTLAINSYAFNDEAVLLAGNNANGIFAVKYYKGKFNAYQRTYVITPIDSEKVSVRWLYFRIKHVTSELQQMSVGTATKFLTKKILDAYEVHLPPFNEQEREADILWLLQDKIELNRQTNQTLEHIAQAIFKSWFVDFEPTHAKITAKQNGQNPERAAMSAISGKPLDQLDQLRPVTQQQLKTTAALFPDALVDSELGEIPEGWGTQTLQDVIELVYGKALKKTDRVSGEYPVYGSGGLTGTHDKSLVDGPGIIVGRKGTVGTLYWEDQSFFPIDTVFYVKCKNGISLVYSYYLLQTLGLEDMNTDAAVPGLNRNNAYRLVIPKVDSGLVDMFTILANSIRCEVCLNREESITLETIRDNLLPRLLAGDFDLARKC